MTVATEVDTLTVRKGIRLEDSAPFEIRDNAGRYLYGFERTGPLEVTYFMAKSDLSGRVPFMKLTMPSASGVTIKVEYIGTYVDVTDGSRLFLGGKQLKVGTDGKPTLG